MDIDEEKIGSWPNVAVPTMEEAERLRKENARLRKAELARGAQADVDAIEDALVSFAQEWADADTRLAEHRLVRRWARRIAGGRDA